MNLKRIKMLVLMCCWIGPNADIASTTTETLRSIPSFDILRIIYAQAMFIFISVSKAALDSKYSLLPLNEIQSKTCDQHI